MNTSKLSKVTVTIDSCPVCNGELTTVAENRDAVVCAECGSVDPQPTESEACDTQLAEHTGDGGDDGLNTHDIKQGWKSKVGVSDSSDENIVEILSLVDAYIKGTKLPQEVRFRAAEVLLSAWEDGLFEGRQKEPLTAGGVYAAARELGYPRPLTKVSNTAEVRESTVNDAYRLVVSVLELEIPIAGPEDYVSYVGRELSLPQPLIHEAATMIEKEIDCSGNPAGIAASVLYLFAADEHDITLRQAGEAAGVSKETVWRHTRTIRNSGHEII